MNEKIKELAKESGFCVYEDEIFVPTTDENITKVTTKFAELIVKECAELAKLHVMNISTYADAEFVDQQIKEHFGVDYV